MHVVTDKMGDVAKTCKVSVVIPCFNHGEFLPEAVASVTQIRRDDVETIVVDDGSTDELTIRQVEKLMAQGVNVIRQVNKGLAAARNAAVQASKGEYILPLDADDRLCAGWIDRGIRILDSDPRVGVVYGDAQWFGARVGRYHAGEFDGDRLLQWNYIHASALYRRAVWEQNRGYDGTMPTQGWEDWDFWLGALERDWQFAYLRQVLFEYRQAEGSMITRVRGFDQEMEDFVAKKHAVLYRQALLRIGRRLRQEDSLKWTVRNLHRLLKSRIIHKLQQ